MTILEDIYSTFNFPEDMKYCSRYGGSQYAVDKGFASSSDNIDPLDAMLGVINALAKQYGVMGKIEIS